jgi:hypothetical protein
MMKNKLKIIAIALMYFCSTEINAQNQCDFEIIDTLSFKIGYFIIYNDTVKYKNTSNRTITLFIKDKREFNTVCIDSIDRYSLFKHLNNLYTQILVYNRPLLEQIKTASHQNKNQKCIKIKKLKTNGLYTLYSIYSPNGFVFWKLSKEQHDEGISIEGLPYTGKNKCIYFYSPMN